MKVAVVGCGAVGSYYGAMLWRAGHAVHFLLRSDLAHVRGAGVRIFSPAGDFIAHPHTAEVPAEIGACDLVLVALKTTANDQLPILLPPLLRPETWVLTLQNGLGNEAQLAAVRGPNRLLGGLCFVCLNRVAPGEIRHLAHGNIVLGEYRRPPSRFTRELADQWRAAGVECRVAEDLERAHWEKLIWNVPFNGLGVAGVVGYDNLLAGRVPPGMNRRRTLPTDELLGDGRWERLVRELMAEVIATAHAVGYPLSAALVEQMVERTRCMGAYKASTLLDFERGAALELDSLFLQPLRCAQGAGVAVPRLAALGVVLRELDRLLP